jgi:parallel beta-helix repeat protein
MDRWKRFIDWCQQPSKVKIRTFNPRNIMVVALSVLIISLITSGSWLYQVLSITQTPDLTRENYESLFPTLTITEDTVLSEDHCGDIIIDADGVTLDGNGYTITGPGRSKYNTTKRCWDISIGISVKGRTGVTVKNCRITNFAFGLILDRSDGCTLLNNTVDHNLWGGIDVRFSFNNTIQENTVYSTRDVEIDDVAAFSLEMSFANTFKGNLAYDNGIGFASGEFERTFFEEERGFTPEKYEGNVFEANTAESNTLAGFYIGSIFDKTFSNKFFHNNLIDNVIQAGVPLGYANSWDDGYPSGGNYWSDYTGVDADDDGIGDTPYSIFSVSWEIDDESQEPFLVLGESDGKNVDRFPLTAPFNG